jgi:hypothetical protein
MERVKGLLYQHQSKLNYVLIGCAGLAAFNCLTRPDYNMIIYIYMYYVWFMMDENKVNNIFLNYYKELQVNEKLNSYYFLCFSFIIDIIWIIFWSGRWSHVKDAERTAHILVVFMSWIEMLLKSGVLFAIALYDWPTISSSLPAKLREQLNPNYGQQKDEINEIEPEAEA